jgi:hypothetical protein
MIRAAEDWGYHLGATFTSLDYHAANTRASLFYRGSMGYRVTAAIAIKRLPR